MKVKDVMTKHTVQIQPEESVSLAARLLERENIGALPVCDSKGKLQGMLTDRDITVRCVAAGKNPNTTPVRDIMSGGVFTVTPGDTLENAAALMGKAQVRRLPVCEDGKPVGMLSLADVARQTNYEMEAAAALSDISAGVRRRANS